MGQSPGNPTSTATTRTRRHGAPSSDDVLFQNLLSAEWAIYSFHQQGVEVFSSRDFTDLGLPNTTSYDRIAQIHDNEAGHLRLLQDHVSSNFVKPGACKYNFGFSNAETYLALQVLLEVSIMAFLTGLAQQAKLNATRGALIVIAEMESRHNTWALIDIFDVTNEFIVPGSCHSESLVYPLPRQNPPPLSFNMNANTGEPGSEIEFAFLDETNVPTFDGGKEYYVIFFRGVNNASVPLGTKRNSSVISLEFESGRGIIVAVLADGVGAPTSESDVAGPMFLLEQPQEFTRQI